MTGASPIRGPSNECQSLLLSLPGGAVPMAGQTGAREVRETGCRPIIIARRSALATRAHPSL
ncbi:hypothetical protein AAur_pTC20016 (plasmid) [Paenarthrobacter aurescens TC1]|uniref:Uncharacterized protein n=1 Tax=Paenarthrobacter aurescens (strain TC1) TaxID=290340 RepID=A1RD70_PAEAT|nr:hypothetical protein AAur_pTC20016 [Paenarthrobacter aurescens TC1]